MRVNLMLILVLAWTLQGGATVLGAGFHGKKKKTVHQVRGALVTIDAGRAQCKADIDGQQEGMTGPTGRLAIEDVEPGEHYLHVRCPGRREISRFIAPRRGEKLHVNLEPSAPGSQGADVSPLDAAVSEIRLHRIVRQAIQLRASGQFGKAVDLLRQATMLDPKNSDLHREIGITFLLNHEWERARVEMLEAIHGDPESAEAHSGLAYAEEKLGDLDAALKEYRICTHLDTEDPSCRRHYIEVLGMLYEQKAQRKN